MHIHYINLESATTRRSSLEGSFSENNVQGDWILSRFAAISGTDERAQKTAGACTDNEKGCFLSHASLVQQAEQSKEVHWIVEDDVRFWPESFAVVSDFINSNADADWDILFTDTVIRSFGSMADLYVARKKLPPQQIEYINLGACPFSSAVSYVINPKRAQKVASVLAVPSSIDKPWDIYVASIVHEGKLTAYFTLPFVTSFAACAQQSQIRDMELDVGVVLSRAFRSLMCVQPDVRLAKEMLSKINPDFVDEQADCFGKIMANFMSDKFPKV